ncbi:hypothetical protein AD998_08150 [bacterium 336/3]|nr:hypothetical protein AD998_08150 [bacterium 336/3]
MFDTLKIILPNLNYSESLIQVLTSVSQHQKDNKHWIIGFLEPFRISITENQVSIFGSLAKYYFGNNFHTLSRHQTKEALENLQDDLQLLLLSEKVSRLDVSSNVKTIHPPKTYFSELQGSKGYQRFENPHSVYWQNSLRTKLVYDKQKEYKQKKELIPSEFTAKNTFRFEVRYQHKTSQILKAPNLDVKTLYNQNFYNYVVSEWLKEFNSIEARKTPNFKPPKNVKDFEKMLIAQTIHQRGLDAIINEIKHFQKNKTLGGNKTTYQREIAKIKAINSDFSLTNDTLLIQELKDKIKVEAQRLIEC